MESIISNSKFCFFCGAAATAKHHLIFGRSQRALADADGIYIPICDMCHTSGALKCRIHDNPMAERESKMLGQSEWEKHYIAVNKCDEGLAREKFISRYGRSYL